MASNERKGLVTGIAAVLIVTFLAGFIPAYFAYTDGTEIESQIIQEGETITLKSPLEATLIDASQNQINVSLRDRETGEIAATQPLSQGNSETVSLRGNDVIVTYTEDIGNNEAVVTFEYPVLYEWPPVAVALLRGFMAVALVLFAYLIFMLYQEVTGN